MIIISRLFSIERVLELDLLVTTNEKTFEVDKMENSKTIIARNTEENKTEGFEALQELVNQSSVRKFSSSAGKGGYLSIIKSTNGTRLVISKSVNEELNYPSEIFIGCEKDHLIIFNSQDTPIEGKKLPENKKGKITIYDTKLVNEIIETFQLDYSGITSKSFAEGRLENKVRSILYVKMV